MSTKYIIKKASKSGGSSARGDGRTSATSIPSASISVRGARHAYCVNLVRRAHTRPRTAAERR